MREIRFRIWDSRFKKWVDPKAVEINASTGLMRGSRGGDGHVDYWEPFQFIGLKDIDGIDVYKGDLLKCSSGDIHEVIFESYFACFNTKHLKSGEVSDITKDGMNECFEKVGHIRENPELLEDHK